MSKKEIEKIISEDKTLRKYLFNRGFFITDHNLELDFAKNEFWYHKSVNGFNFSFHKNENFFCQASDNTAVVLLGHAYNPVNMISDENEILKVLLKAENDSEFHSILGELTGIYLICKIEASQIKLYGDAAGMQTVFYGNMDNKIYIASHSKMIEYALNLKKSDYVQRLINYRFYGLFGISLPGDISPYDNFYRLIPNHYVKLNDTDNEIHRYYPINEYKEYTHNEIPDAVNRISQLMSNNMKLIAKKWNKPAISLTGGCDSKTTLACARDCYDSYNYFSYISNPSEAVDAQAAGKICSSLGLKHKIYTISENDSDFKNIESVRQIINDNNGDIGKSNSNDVRKRAFFAEIDDFDVEVKSWVSECGRAYYNKRFAKKVFPKNPTPHYLTTLYKVFVTDQKLIKRTDKIFAEYISKYLSNNLLNYPWQELFFWEFRMSSWNGLVISGEHKFSFDITIPYNNRIIIDMLLRMPADYRVNDEAYKLIRNEMNPKIDETGISVTNVKHTSNRAKIERIYLEVMSRLHF